MDHFSTSRDPFVFLEMESNSQFLTNQQIEKRVKEAATLINLQNKVRAQIIEKIAEKKSDKYFFLERLKELLPHEYIIWPMERKQYGYDLQYIWDTKILTSDEVEKEPLSIKTLCYKTQHGSKTLADEKRIFREMRRAKEITDTKMNQNQVTFAEIQNMRREKRIFNHNVQNLKRKLESIKNDIKSLENSLYAINQKKGKIYAAIFQLKRQNYTT
ncbi:hypothetical protein R3W88_023362 [Solanum pinnatisectum]|uniref:Uncharacterized protein n=1 Tax=Solanum pinnatisectum TaxID=50273 RepID=A0AAV9LXC3_9SOLN|nr:hypothetical protein R3W88_023362 [Solanum pinnatisectum]